MPNEAMDLTLCLYPDGVASVVERCCLEPSVGTSVHPYGPVPEQMDQTSFRAFFVDPSLTRLRSYTCPEADGERMVAMSVEASVATQQPCTVSYQTSGITWQVWYDCILRGGRAVLSAYLSVSNATAITIGPAILRFVVPRGSSVHPYHAFSTQRAVTIPSNSTTHVELFTSSEVPICSRLVAPANSPMVLDEMYVVNSAESGLGIELPPGPIRVFQDLPPLLRIDTGAFPFTLPGDEIGLRSVIAEDVILHGGWDYDSGVANLHVHNDRAEPISVQVEETEEAVDIAESSHPLCEDASGGFRYFLVDVAPGATSRLSYRLSASALRRHLPPGYQRPPEPAFSMQPVGSHLPNPHLA